jgi:hypothetical protein
MEKNIGIIARQHFICSDIIGWVSICPKEAAVSGFNSQEILSFRDERTPQKTIQIIGVSPE